MMSRTHTTLTYAVVDDHAPIVMAVRASLSHVPWLQYVGEAYDGASGIDLLTRLEPDLAIVDIRMPGLDGVGVIAEAARRGLATRIVLHSAFTSPAVLELATRVGAAACVTKGSRPDVLIEAFRRAGHGSASSRVS